MTYLNNYTCTFTYFILSKDLINPWFKQIYSLFVNSISLNITFWDVIGCFLVVFITVVDKSLYKINYFYIEKCKYYYRQHGFIYKLIQLYVMTMMALWIKPCVLVINKHFVFLFHKPFSPFEHPFSERFYIHSLFTTFPYYIREEV